MTKIGQGGVFDLARWILGFEPWTLNLVPCLAPYGERPPKRLSYGDLRFARFPGAGMVQGPVFNGQERTRLGARQRNRESWNLED